MKKRKSYREKKSHEPLRPSPKDKTVNEEIAYPIDGQPQTKEPYFAKG
jgi:hypothetical protein